MHSSDGPPVKNSMLRVAIRLVVFCLPLAAAVAFVELCLAHVPNGYSVKRQRLAALSSEVDTLILGSSSAYYGISPSGLSGSAFNLAYVAQTLYNDDRLLSQVIPKLPMLKRVILTAGYFSLFVQFSRGGLEGWREYYYKQEWGIAPRFLQDRLDFRMWSRLALSMPPFPQESIRMGLQAMSVGTKLEIVPDMDERGWWNPKPRDTTADLSPAAAAIPLGRHHSEMRESDVGDNISYLEHSLVALRARNIEVFLVTLPVWHTYSDGMRADTWERASQTYDRIAREHGARYLSYLNMPQLMSEDFLDTDHLNSRGAARFTAILNAAMGPSAKSAGR
jgi:hypothetical protein